MTGLDTGILKSTSGSIEFDGHPWQRSDLKQIPGTIAILCSLAHQEEERAGKYYSVLSAPVSLKQFEYAKVLILIEKLLMAAVFLAIFAAVSNLISPALAVYSMGRNFIGSFALI